MKKFLCIFIDNIYVMGKFVCCQSICFRKDSYVYSSNVSLFNCFYSTKFNLIKNVRKKKFEKSDYKYFLLMGFMVILFLLIVNF